MITSAPGKLVLSGAYVVLDGAPAVVTAVDRRATADASRLAEFLSPELRAAFGDAAPFVDSSTMRLHGRKLGLGSSAAVLVAAIGARELALGRALHGPLLEAIAGEAYAAHRAAQGGGSGIDITAATFGGTLICHTRPEGTPSHLACRLPPGLCLEAWVCPESASTPSLLAPVRELRRRSPERYQALTSPARLGAEEVARALPTGDLRGLLAGLQAQAEGMSALGDAAGVPILPGYLRELAQVRPSGSVVAQSGAGGGDIALYFGLHPSPTPFRREAERLGLSLLPIGFEAPGLQAEGAAARASAQFSS